MNEINLVKELQQNLKNITNENIEDLKNFIVNSPFWKSSNHKNLHRLVSNILLVVIYRPTMIKNISMLVSEVIRSDPQIGLLFQNILETLLFNSVRQIRVFPNKSSHFTFIYYLERDNVISIDRIAQEIHWSSEDGFRNLDFILYAFESYREVIKTKFAQSHVLEILEVDSKIFPQCLHEFIQSFQKNKTFNVENDVYEADTLRNCLKSDNLERLLLFSAHPDFNFNQILSPSIFEPCLLLQHYPTILQYTAYYGSVKCFNYLILNDADMNITDDVKRPLFNFAVAGGNIEIIRIIEQQKEQNNLDLDGALHVAALFWQNDIFHWLSKSPHFRDLSLSKQSKKKNTILHQAAQSNNLEIISLCLKHKVKINQSNYAHSSALLIAAAYDNYDAMQLMFTNPKLNPNQLNDGDFTPLTIAIERCNIEAVRFLIECSTVDVNIKNSYEENALHIAAKYGNIEIFQLIHYKIKDVNEKQLMGQTALHIAVSEGNKPIIIDLMKDDNVDLNVQDAEGWAPLHLAAQFGFSDVVELFIQYKEKVNFSIKTINNKTPLDLAKTEKRNDVIYFLEKYI